LRTLEFPLRVDLLIHRREAVRPTSTSHLIRRALPASRGHLFSPDIPLAREQIALPGRELWILHPAGDAPPPGAPVAALQVLLLDGSWREAARMRKAVESWGRLVRLPAGAPSRYELRRQHCGDRYSTAETLFLLMESLGLTEAAARLRTQFELHVYAGLRSRGALEDAERFLAGSALEQSLPTVLRDLQQRRRRP